MSDAKITEEFDDLVGITTYVIHEGNNHRYIHLDDSEVAALRAHFSAERDALAAVIEEARALARPGQSVPPGVSLWMHFDSLLAATHRKLSEAPSDVLVERDARIRAEVIDWIAGRIRSIPHWWDADTKYGEFDLEPLGPRHTSEQGAYMEVSRAVDDAREHFGLTKGAE